MKLSVQFGTLAFPLFCSLHGCRGLLLFVNSLSTGTEAMTEGLELANTSIPLDFECFKRAKRFCVDEVLWSVGLTYGNML